MDGNPPLYVDAGFTNGTGLNFQYDKNLYLHLYFTTKHLILFVQWTNYLNPENIKGLSALTMLLALIGNGLVLPRALFIRDFMW